MRHTKRKLAGLALACAVPILGAVLNSLDVHGQTTQTPTWPKTDKKEKFACSGEGNCASCAADPKPSVGCTASLRGTPWGAGWCRPDDTLGAGMGCERTNFACGAALTCSSGQPTGNTCTTVDYCKNYEGG